MAYLDSPTHGCAHWASHLEAEAKDGKLRWLEAMGRNVVNTAANIKLTVGHLGIYVRTSRLSSIQRARFAGATPLHNSELCAIA